MPSMKLIGRICSGIQNLETHIVMYRILRKPQKYQTNEYLLRATLLLLKNPTIIVVLLNVIKDIIKSQLISLFQLCQPFLRIL